MAFGKEVISLGDSENASIVEIDDIHSYIGSKKTYSYYLVCYNFIKKQRYL